MNRTILHIDINSYFATLLQQENPLLRGRPIGVVKAVGRTCLIATSKEAKQYGIKTGCRLKEARLLYPKILPIAAQLDRYLDATKRLKAIFESIAPHVEIFSLDEAFVDISDCRDHLYRDPHQLAFQIQTRIKQELGEWVTCNIGISYNRLLAKIASEINPPDTVFEITEQNKDAILGSMAFKDVCGVGYRLEKKLRRLGIATPYMIRFHSQQELTALVGPFWAVELLKIAYGEEGANLERLDDEPPHMKSVGRSITGYKLCNDEAEIARVLYNLIDEVTHKVRRMNLAGREVGIYLTGSDQRGDHRGWYKHLTLHYYIRHTQDMFDLLYHQLYQPWPRSFAIIKFAVRLGMCKPLTEITPSLLPSWEKHERLAAAQDKITEKYGLFTLRSGLLTNQPIIRPEVTGYLGDKLYQLGSHN